MEPLLVNDDACISGKLTLPRNGPWTFSGIVNREDAFEVGEDVTVSIAGQKWKCRIVSQGGRNNARSFLAYAGKASAIQRLSAEHFSSGSPYATLANTILNKHDGEFLPSDVSDGVTQRWSAVQNETVADYFGRLSKAIDPDCVWRQDKEGRFYFSKDEFDEVTVDLQETTPDWLHVSRVYSLVDDVPDSIVPGANVNGMDVGEVQISFGDSKYTLTLSENGKTLNEQTKKNTIDKQFNEILLSRFWPGKVTAFNPTSFRISFKPDDDLISGLGLENVPPLWAFPGTIKVSAGQRVCIFFKGGDPQRPFYFGYESTSTSEIRFGAAEQFVALANLVDARVDTLQQAIDTHIHPSSMGPTGTNTMPVGQLASTACSKVKAE